MFTLQEKNAFDYCTALAKKHYENFPVGSLLIPKEKQPFIHAVYAFARTADDFADELSFQGDRIQALDEWLEKLDQCYNGNPSEPIFIALAKTVETCNIPKQLLQDLVFAFKLDVLKNKHESFEELLFYCKHSANPVGRLVLLIFGHQNKKWMEYSDAICTALQLANFWQDITVDIQKNRIYLPVNEMQQFGVLTSELHEKTASEAFRALIKYQVERTQGLFNQGLPLCAQVRPWRLAMELKCVWQGGVKILQKIKAQNYDVLKLRPTLSKFDFLGCAWRSLWM